MMNRYRRILSIFISLGVALSFASMAAADEQPAPEIDGQATTQTAMDYYEEARGAYADGNYDRAAELLGLAWEHDDNIIYRYNQILALQGAGDYHRALELVDEYEDRLRGSEMIGDIDEIRDDLHQARDARRTAHSADGSETLDRPASGDDTGASPLAWSLVGTGGASFAAALVVGSGLLINDTVDRLENSRTIDGRRQIYSNGEHDRDADLQALTNHRRLAVGLAAGGAIISAAGGLLLWSNRSPGAAGETAALRLAPMVDIDTTGAALRGRF